MDASIIIKEMRSDHFQDTTNALLEASYNVREQYEQYTLYLIGLVRRAENAGGGGGRKGPLFDETVVEHFSRAGNTAQSARHVLDLVESSITENLTAINALSNLVDSLGSDGVLEKQESRDSRKKSGLH